MMSAAERAQIVERIGNRRIVVSVSGGKDSTAACLYLRENGFSFDMVFCDTGWEHPDTYDYLRHVLAPALGQIEWLTPPLQMVELIRNKGIFPSGLVRFCTQELKIFPLQRYFERRLEEGVDCVNVVGVRAAESAARAKMTEWEQCDGFEAETWRPLLHKSEQWVIDTMTVHGIPPNPLYLKGASRVGCWPCIYARKEEIKFLARNDPKRVDLIRQLEQEITEAANVRAMVKGEPMPLPRTWFREKDGTGGSIPRSIDAAVSWATLRHQGELFMDPNPGCMRWGLCESMPTKEQ